MQFLSRAQWEPRATDHHNRAKQLVSAHMERRKSGQRHPVEDFLFEYYNFTPGQLMRWHPGIGVTLLDSDEYEGRSGYDLDPDSGGHRVSMARLRQRRDGIAWMDELLRRTAARKPKWDCFGLHEWAMVYGPKAEIRHEVPLRLGKAGTDTVVEQHSLCCTHIDAFRFFTADAVPRNRIQPTRETQLGLEQPGCLHANMDLYRIAFRLIPFIDASIVLDTFELARDIRAVDMRASPYDLSAWGYEPICIETPRGKAQYVAAQRDFAARAARFRHQLRDHCATLLNSVHGA